MQTSSLKEILKESERITKKKKRKEINTDGRSMMQKVN